MVDVSTADPLLGQQLDGRYRVDARVARGGMATVYAGFDLRLDRAVAVKVMHPSFAADEEFVDRFRREAKSAARLSHPNVVAIFDQGEDAGHVYLVMEHVPGTTLRDLLREEGRLDSDRALAVTDGILSALAAAHDAGIVHRDVKPENVLLTEAGVVKVADFGLARAIEANDYSVVSGTLIGTVAYLAPEQVTTGAADARTDLYATGVVLYEMLTGGPPFTGDTPLSVAYRHVNEDVPAPSAARPGLPRALDQLVAAATQRDAAERYADAREMHAAVRRVRAGLGGSDTAVIPLGDQPTLVTRLPAAPPVPPKQQEPAPAAPAKPPRRPRRRKVVTALVIGVILGIAGFAGWYYGSSRPVDVPRLATLTVEQATAAAEAEGLQVRVGEPVFDETIAVGRIAEQDPEPGESLRRGGTITVRASKGRDLVAMPELRGKTEQAARGALADARLGVGKVTREFHPTTPEGSVIRAGAAAGATLRPGTKVDFVVSRGREPVTVPKLVGKQLGDAGRILAGLGLTYDRTLEYSDTAPEGEVMEQRPGEGVTLFKGAKVDLVVSRGPRPVAVPDVVGKTRADAGRILSEAGLRAEFVDFPGKRGRRVYDQDPNAGTEVRKGTTVTLYMV